MLLLKYLMLTGAVGLIAGAALVVLADAYTAHTQSVPVAVRWRRAAGLLACGWLLLLPA
jgi:hypothetical protein